MSQFQCPQLSTGSSRRASVTRYLAIRYSNSVGVSRMLKLARNVRQLTWGCGQYPNAGPRASAPCIQNNQYFGSGGEIKSGRPVFWRKHSLHRTGDLLLPLRTTSSCHRCRSWAGWRGRQALSGCKAFATTGTRVVNARTEKRSKSKVSLSGRRGWLSGGVNSSRAARRFACEAFAQEPIDHQLGLNLMLGWCGVHECAGPPSLLARNPAENFGREWWVIDVAVDRGPIRHDLFPKRSGLLRTPGSRVL